MVFVFLLEDSLPHLLLTLCTHLFLLYWMMTSRKGPINQPEKAFLWLKPHIYIKKITIKRMTTFDCRFDEAFAVEICIRGMQVLCCLDLLSTVDSQEPVCYVLLAVTVAIRYPSGTPFTAIFHSHQTRPRRSLIFGNDR